MEDNIYETQMNTTMKGDLLEEKVYEIYKKKIDRGELGFNKSCCKLHRKKRYYSKKREADIIFDVSLELFLPGEEHYYIVLLIECKNYSHSVSVDEVEEFNGKISQVAEANGKGILITTKGFQSGAITLAKSLGMGLARVFEDGSLDWTLQRSVHPLIDKSDYHESVYHLDSETKRSRYLRYYSLYGTHAESSLWELTKYIARCAGDDNPIANEESSKVPHSLSVPYRDESCIDDICCEIRKDIGLPSGAIGFDEMSGYLRKSRGFSVCMEDLPPGIIGNIDFSKKVISIDNGGLVDPARSKFTLAHEMGHCVLGHDSFIRRESYRSEYSDVNIRKFISHKNILRIEYQANHFASSFLMPKLDFTKQAILKMESMGLRGGGRMYLDDQPCNQDSFYTLSKYLSEKYIVSISAIKVRLLNLDLLELSNSGARRIHGVLKGMNYR